jgi:DNA repair exonuclease SbcCD ATPase subunit
MLAWSRRHHSRCPREWREAYAALDSVFADLAEARVAEETAQRVAAEAIAERDNAIRSLQDTIREYDAAEREVAELRDALERSMVQAEDAIASGQTATLGWELARDRAEAAEREVAELRVLLEAHRAAYRLECLNDDLDEPHDSEACLRDFETEALAWGRKENTQ